MTKKTYTPIGRKVLIKMMEAEASQGGIFIPDEARTKSKIGTVVQLGTVKPETSDLTVGTKVLVPEYGGHVVHIDNTKHLMLEEDDIIAIVDL